MLEPFRAALAARAAVTTVAACAALVLAACGGDSTPTVQQAPVATVVVTPSAPTVVVGRTTRLDVTLRDAAGATLTSRQVAWSSSDAAIARVDPAGVVAGIAPGTAVVTVTSEGRSGQATVTVQPVPVATVVVAPATPSVAVGATVTLAATLRDDAGTTLTGREVRWTSSAPAVATVDAATGVVRGVAAGTATITATSETRTGTATVTVTAPVVPVASVTIAGAAAPDTIEAYETVTLQATLRDRDGAALVGRAVRWTSSNPAVARIDETTGALTGVDRGTVTVTATSEGVSGTATRVVVIRYRSVSAGTMHACDIASGGIVWCWGLAGDQGRLGDGRTGQTVTATAPVQVAGDVRFTQVASFARHTCGIATDGRAYCWGYNGWGMLGDGTSTNRPTPVAVSTTERFRSITAGTDHSCGLTTDNRAVCWGYNASGELGTGNRTSQSTPSAVASTLTFTTIDAGTNFTCAVATGGAGYCWGYSGVGNLGDGGPISFGNTSIATPNPVTGGHTFRSISTGNLVACGVTTLGVGFCWGGAPAQLGAGPANSETSTPVRVMDVTFQSIDVGYVHACGVAVDAAVWCWGRNGYGQIGTTDINGTNRPVRVGSIRAAEVSAAGIGTGNGGHTCAISADRLTTWCWGLNDVGQLGRGTTTPVETPNPTPAPVQGQRPLAATR